MYTDLMFSFSFTDNGRNASCDLDLISIDSFLICVCVCVCARSFKQYFFIFLSLFMYRCFRATEIDIVSVAVLLSFQMTSVKWISNKTSIFQKLRNNGNASNSTSSSDNHKQQPNEIQCQNNHILWFFKCLKWQTSNVNRIIYV